ncbi:hypothetical protein ACOMHN_029094 [Nucella lapillus]
MPKTAKCVVVGDEEVGKTCLLICYTTNVFPRESVPTKFDSYTAVLNIRGYQVRYDLWDTIGQDEYDQLRPLDYQNADVFMVCFSVADHTSFERVTSKWVPELTKHSPGIPMVLVGTKHDLHDDPGTIEQRKQKDQAPITTQQGSDLAEQIGAVRYVECSALEKRGLTEAFDAALEAGLEDQIRREEEMGEGEGEETACSLCPCWR